MAHLTVGLSFCPMGDTSGGPLCSVIDWRHSVVTHVLVMSQRMTLGLLAALGAVPALIAWFMTRQFGSLSSALRRHGCSAASRGPLGPGVEDARHVPMIVDRVAAEGRSAFL